jgi:hypothetical protein
VVLKTRQANLIEKIVIFTGNCYPINKCGKHFYITLTIQPVVLAPISQLGFFLTINARLFFKRAKHIIGNYEVVQENLGVKKVQTPLKNLEKSPIMCFASLQKITSQTIGISSASVFLCTGATICPKLFPFNFDHLFLSLLRCFDNNHCRKCTKNIDRNPRKVRMILNSP